MYYDPRTEKPRLAHDPFNALVAPRPIAWISTINAAGRVNLAPYSYFNIVATKPPFVMFSSAQRKDSQRNAEERGEFVISMATYELREQVNLSSAEYGPHESEPETLAIEMVDSIAVKPPRVKRSPAALECRYAKTVSLPGANGEPHSYSIVIGEVVGIFVDDRIVREGIVSIASAHPIARLGYMDYCEVDEVFAMQRPRRGEKPGT
jgi:flavin reductase (DIM6/NTAB) family NADH-FMN oxidoreductase RutF